MRRTQRPEKAGGLDHDVKGDRDVEEGQVREGDVETCGGPGRAGIQQEGPPGEPCLREGGAIISTVVNCLP